MNSSTTTYIVLMIRRVDKFFVKHVITSHGLSIEGFERTSCTKKDQDRVWKPSTDLKKIEHGIFQSG